MTRGELRARMTHDEFVMQVAFDDLEAQEAKHEAAKAEMRQSFRQV